jgi:hypothetical protein
MAFWTPPHPSSKERKMCRLIHRIKNPLPFVHAAYGSMEAETYCEEHNVILDQIFVAEGDLCIIGKIEKIVDEKLKALEERLCGTKSPPSASA